MRDVDFELRLWRQYNLVEFVYRATLESLKNMAAYTRATARNNTSRVKRKSALAGDIWSSHKGKPLHYAIQFGVDKDKLYAVVGPKTHNRKSPSRTAPHAIEYGGVTVARPLVLTEQGLQAKQERLRNASRRRRQRRSMSKRQFLSMRDRLTEAGSWVERRKAERVGARRATYTYRMQPRPTMYISLLMSAPFLPNSARYAFTRTRVGHARYFGPNGKPLGRTAILRDRALERKMSKR